MKVVTVVGARPQFVKASAVSRAIESMGKKRKWAREVLVHTGQHYDYFMDQVFFEELRLPKPDYHLGVGSGAHARQTGLMLERIETVLEKEKPDWVIVYGDTNSTLAGALAAGKLNIPIAHVEAGLRSYNRRMPEEINRLLTDHLATLLFCPTTLAVKNLRLEGIKDGGVKGVKNVGDVMYDSILYYSMIAEQESTILENLGFSTHDSKLKTYHYYLATLHRAENTDHPKKMRSILRGLNEMARDAPVILPLHPRAKKMMEIHHLLEAAKGIRLIEPVSYLDMLKLEKHATMILTDSGGVQKEAYWFRVPCLTLRDETEWVETVESGWNTLAGAGMKIAEKARRAMSRKRSSGGKQIFGNGKASEKIVQILTGWQ